MTAIKNCHSTLHPAKKSVSNGSLYAPANRRATRGSIGFSSNNRYLIPNPIRPALDRTRSEIKGATSLFATMLYDDNPQPTVGFTDKQADLAEKAKTRCISLSDYLP